MTHDMTMTTETAQPDTMPVVEAMSLEEIQRELANYKPGTRETVVTVEEWLARRRALWRHLDVLLARPGAAGQR